MTGAGTDRRPWLILSRSEALALVQVVDVFVPAAQRSGTLRRAVQQVALQVDWIEGRADGYPPSKLKAAERELGEYWVKNGTLP